MKKSLTGPALKHVDSHSAIHEAALEEAKELTELLESCIEAGKTDEALELAYLIVEHWESRTLQHAQSEEEGLYKEAVERKPHLRDAVLMLTRDHNLMRYLVEEIKELLAEEGAIREAWLRFSALIHIDMLHNRDEERMIEAEIEELGNSYEQTS
ncbi:hemerythrin domain-containing protein [Paenibacillus thiaminolyticus]|uniref:hemerythrin domain-containing protein n=1 Tax=Paenibacillus thiaminolyticus TaxID=49283 RepID=UPI00217609C2|nr:hemerythrin domain-containing protein [Paenibacillus thiaminolyticus]